MPPITLEKGKPNSVFDADGSAVMIHAGKDDYKTDPTGDARRPHCLRCDLVLRRQGFQFVRAERW